VNWKPIIYLVAMLLAGGVLALRLYDWLGRGQSADWLGMILPATFIILCLVGLMRARSARTSYGTERNG